MDPLRWCLEFMYDRRYTEMKSLVVNYPKIDIKNLTDKEVSNLINDMNNNIRNYKRGEDFYLLVLEYNKLTDKLLVEPDDYKGKDGLYKKSNDGLNKLSVQQFQELIKQLNS